MTEVTQTPTDFDSPLDFTIQLLSSQTKLTEENFVDYLTDNAPQLTLGTASS